MRIYGFIFAFALILPFVLPEPGSGLKHNPADASLFNTPQASARTMSARQSLDLKKVVWALGVLDREGMSEESTCLAQAVYFEARSEPVEGQLAVAQVVLNRARNPSYPDTICGVVFQNERMRHRCQFSFACDGLSDTPFENKAWDLARRVAFVALSGRWEDITDGADHYHAVYVRPSWSEQLEPTGRHGTHIFYRDGAY